jgi:hypothetical protein
MNTQNSDATEDNDGWIIDRNASSVLRSGRLLNMNALEEDAGSLYIASFFQSYKAQTMT